MYLDVRSTIGIIHSEYPEETMGVQLLMCYEHQERQQLGRKQISVKRSHWTWHNHETKFPILETADLFRVQIFRETINKLVKIVPRTATGHTIPVRVTNTGLVTMGMTCPCVV
jgi:hypothetical protein